MKKTILACFVLPGLCACVKEDKPVLYPLHYEVKASGAPKFVISHAASGYQLELKDTLEVDADAQLNWSRHLEKEPNGFYYLKVSPLPANSTGVEMELRVFWKNNLLDSTSLYVQKGLALSGFLP